jgi:hypothetical protein
LVEDAVSAEELAMVDDAVAGRRPLPLESLPGSGDDLAPLQHRSPYGRLLDALERPAFAMAPVMIAWETAVLLVRGHGGSRVAFVCLPGASLEGFLQALARGDLDATITAYLRSRPSGRVLSRHEQTAAAGLYDELGPRLGLLAAERAPEQGRAHRLRALLGQAA